jgi:ABC-type oligopeptide transport system ATPase subunit
LENLITIENIKKYFPVYGGVLKRKVADVKAVDGVSINIYKGECFGVVGESGCGKTTLGKTIIRLLNPNSGHIFFRTPKEIVDAIKYLEKNDPKSRALKNLLREYDIAYLRGKRLKKLRKYMQIVFQDPSTSLNPRMLVKDIVAEPLVAQGLARGKKAEDHIVKVLEMVGLSRTHLYRYPHEFSGGQRQR